MSEKIKLSKPFIDLKERKLVDSVLKKGWLTNGPLTQKIEKKNKINNFIFKFLKLFMIKFQFSFITLMGKDTFYNYKIIYIII